MMQISMVIISFHALIFVLLAKVSNGQASCDQQNLANYLTCLTTDANAAVQFLAVSQTDANFVSSLDACFTK
uniref:Secreted protein n=1 Tax=Romanomermis culicivorax TaxID=13658 RepID=A0A915L897_ROMCU